MRLVIGSSYNENRPSAAPHSFMDDNIRAVFMISTKHINILGTIHTDGSISRSLIGTKK